MTGTADESAMFVPGASSPAATLVTDADHLGPGTALADSATVIQATVNAGDTPTACADITNLLGLVKAQTGKHLSFNATMLTTDANNLAASLGCCRIGRACGNPRSQDRSVEGGITRLLSGRLGGLHNPIVRGI